jgi:hypothetical protein
MVPDIHWGVARLKAASLDLRLRMTKALGLEAMDAPVRLPSA